MTGAAPGSGPGPGTTTDPTPVAPPPAGRARRRISWRTRFFALAAVAVIAGVAWLLLGDRVLVVRSVTRSEERRVGKECLE